VIVPHPTLSANAMPLLGQYLRVCLKKAETLISAPKGARLPHPPMFGLTMRFAASRTGRRGTIIAPHPNLSAKARPPSWQYLSRLLSQRRRSSPPKECDPCTLSKIQADLQGFLASGGGR
jgi:hypothetical protein